MHRQNFSVIVPLLIEKKIIISKKFVYSKLFLYQITHDHIVHIYNHHFHNDKFALDNRREYRLRL